MFWLKNHVIGYNTDNIVLKLEHVFVTNNNVLNNNKINNSNNLCTYKQKYNHHKNIFNLVYFIIS